MMMMMMMMIVVSVTRMFLRFDCIGRSGVCEPGDVLRSGGTFTRCESYGVYRDIDSEERTKLLHVVDQLER